MRKRRAILLALFLAFASLPALAQTNEDYCAPYPTIPINVTPVFDEPAMDFTTDLADLQVLGRDLTRAIPHFEGVILGVTSYKPIIEFKASFMKLPLADGSFCARVDHLNATIGYRDITVHVARAFPEGSCDFQHIMTHEQKHVAVNRAVLEEYTRLTHEKLEELLRVQGLSITANPDYAQSQLRERVDAILKDIARQMLEENRRRQRQVDSPQEYASNDVACQGHLAEVARRFHYGQGGD